MNLASSTTTLGDTCSFTNGGTPSTSELEYYRGNIPWITSADMTEDAILSPRSCITSEAIKNSATKLVPAGTILLVTRTGVGKTAITQTPVCFSQDITGITPDPAALDTVYLAHFLRTRVRYFQNYQRGATIKGITREVLANLKIPLPPLPEQRRIAALLDKADEIRKKRQEALRLTDEFLRSVFLDIFGDPLRNPKGWKTFEIKDLGEVVTGNTPSRKRPEYYGNAIEWIKSDNINTPFHMLTEAEERLSSEGMKLGRVVPAPAVLVTCIAGTPECVGNIAIADRPVAFNQQINAIVPGPKINVYFLYMQLLIGKRLVQDASTKSMKGLVSKGKFERIKLACPPRELQDRFASHFLQIERMAAIQRKSEQETKRMGCSLNRTVFG